MQNPYELPYCIHTYSMHPYFFHEILRIPLQRLFHLPGAGWAVSAVRRQCIDQCCETAPQFFMAYGLWRVMAFVFMAYGGKSKIGEKAIICIIRRNTARFVFLSKNTAKCGLFWRFFRNFSCFFERF